MIFFFQEWWANLFLGVCWISYLCYVVEMTQLSSELYLTIYWLIIFTLKTRRLRLTKFKVMTQSHSSRKWQSMEAGPSKCLSKAHAVASVFCCFLICSAKLFQVLEFTLLVNIYFFIPVNLWSHYFPFIPPRKKKREEPTTAMV